MRLNGRPHPEPVLIDRPERHQHDRTDQEEQSPETGRETGCHAHKRRLDGAGR